MNIYMFMLTFCQAFRTQDILIMDSKYQTNRLRARDLTHRLGCHDKFVRGNFCAVNSQMCMVMDLPPPSGPLAGPRSHSVVHTSPHISTVYPALGIWKFASSHCFLKLTTYVERDNKLMLVLNSNPGRKVNGIWLVAWSSNHIHLRLLYVCIIRY